MKDALWEIRFLGAVLGTYPFRMHNTSRADTQVCPLFHCEPSPSRHDGFMSYSRKNPYLIFFPATLLQHIFLKEGRGGTWNP